MFSIFTSSKKFVLESGVDSQIILQWFRERIQDDGPVSQLKGYFSASVYYIGGVDERDIRVRVISMWHNPLEPTLRLHVAANPSGGSVVTGWYTTSLFIRAFLIVWMCLGIGITLFMAFHTHTSAFALQALAFPFYGAIFVIVMRLLARGNEEKLVKFVRHELNAVSGKG